MLKNNIQKAFVIIIKMNVTVFRFPVQTLCGIEAYYCAYQEQVKQLVGGRHPLCPGTSCCCRPTYRSPAFASGLGRDCGVGLRGHIVGTWAFEAHTEASLNLLRPPRPLLLELQQGEAGLDRRAQSYTEWRLVNVQFYILITLEFKPEPAWRRAI